MNSREHLRTPLNSPRLNSFAVLTYCASLIGPLQLPLIVKAQGTNSCSSSNPVLLDTVIVGAGGTGLFAGYTLRRNGYDNFQILEASSKVGGRIQDLPSDFSGDALRLDLGPAFAFNGLEPLREVLDLRDDEEWVTESVLYDPEDGERCEIRTDGQVTCSDIDELGGGTREMSAAASMSTTSPPRRLARIPGAGAPKAPTAAPVCAWGTSDAREAWLPRLLASGWLPPKTNNSFFIYRKLGTLFLHSSLFI